MRAKLGYTYQSKVSSYRGVAVVRAEYLDGGILVGLKSVHGEAPVVHVPECFLDLLDEEPVKPHAIEEVALSQADPVTPDEPSPAAEQPPCT